jgi:hypothetical protein
MLPFASFDIAGYALDVVTGLDFTGPDVELLDAIRNRLRFFACERAPLAPPPTVEQAGAFRLGNGLVDRDFRHYGPTFAITQRSDNVFTWRSGERDLFYIERFEATSDLARVARQVEADAIHCALTAIDRHWIQGCALVRRDEVTILAGARAATRELAASMVGHGYRLLATDIVLFDEALNVLPFPLQLAGRELADASVCRSSLPGRIDHAVLVDEDPKSAWRAIAADDGRALALGTSRNCFDRVFSATAWYRSGRITAEQQLSE